MSMKTYVISNRWKTILYGSSAFGILLFGSFALIMILPREVTPLVFDGEEEGLKKWLALVYLMGALVSILLIVKTNKKKVIITKTTIKNINLFGVSELKFSEIKKIDIEKYPKFPHLKQITITPLSKETEKLSFTYSILDQACELVSILENSNWEQKDSIKDQEKEILGNKSLDRSIQERHANLKKANLVVKILNFISVAVIVGVIKCPQFFKYILISCLTLPIIAIITLVLWKDIVVIEPKRDTTNTNVIIAFLPIIILAILAQDKYFITDYSNLWLPIITVATIIVALFLAGNKKIIQRKLYKLILRISIFSVVYGYVFAIGVNCVFDTSKPEVFISQVLYKRSYGLSLAKFYKIEVETWSPDLKAGELFISKDFFENLEVGDEVSVNSYKGLFNIPWVEADRAK